MKSLFIVGLIVLNVLACEGLQSKYGSKGSDLTYSFIDTAAVSTISCNDADKGWGLYTDPSNCEGIKICIPELDSDNEFTGMYELLNKEVVCPSGYGFSMDKFGCVEREKMDCTQQMQFNYHNNEIFADRILKM